MFYGLGQAAEDSFSASGVVEFSNITAADISRTLATNASAQLDTSTPGGAAVDAWAKCGYAMDESCMAGALAAGMSKSKNRVVREAGQASLTMASTMYAGCSASGVGAAVAPLCGAMGAVVGAIAGVFTAAAGARHEAGTALRAAWYGANLAFARSIQAVKEAYKYAGGQLTDEQAACLIVEAMKARGSNLTDRIWGPYTTKDYNAPCGIPGRICNDASMILMTAQAYQPFPADYTNAPHYAMMEKWWMLKGDGHYGNCVNDGDIEPDAAYHDKTSTRRTRASRMELLADQIVDATEVVIATMINLKDQRSRELARAYYRSEQYQQDVAAAASGARSIQQSYGEFMHASAVALKRHCGMSKEEAGALLSQGSKVFMPVLRECQMEKLLDAGYSPDEAAKIMTSGNIDGALQRAAALEQRERRGGVAKVALAVVAIGVIGVGGYLAYSSRK